MELALLAAAVGFSLINGLNDGGALLSVHGGGRGRPLWRWLSLTFAVAVVPALLGTAVATTLASRLVAFGSERGAAALLVALGAATAVSLALAWRGLPTSLTLALIGAIAGVGAGMGLDVSWSSVALVIALAALAPLLGVGAAWLLVRGADALPSRAPIRRRLKRWRLLAHGAQHVAYGLNDGQKMLAVAALALGASSGAVEADWRTALLTALPFAVGAAVGLPRFAGTLGSGVLPLTPPAATLAQGASAVVVLATGALGAPVSMSQAISGSVVGTSIPQAQARVRWRVVAQIGAAWVLTLPLSAGLAWLVARLLLLAG